MADAVEKENIFLFIPNLIGKSLKAMCLLYFLLNCVI